MRVRDLVEDPALDLRLEVVGDLERPIRWVHTIEVADPGRFLRGGEVVLTAGVWRSAGVTSEEFVASLAEADVAAVGYGLVPSSPDTPEEFLDAARRYGLTCFVVPLPVAFIQITEAFVAAKREEWERPLRSHLTQYDAIVAALRGERGVATILRVLGRQLGLPVAVRSGGEVVGEPPENACELPLVGEGLADATLLLDRPFGDLGTEQQAAVAQAMPFMALEIERLRAVRATELRYASELFDWAYAGEAHLPRMETRLRSLGIRSDGPLAGMIVRTTDPAAAASALNRALGSRGVAVVRGSIAAGIALVHEPVATCAARLHHALPRGAVLGIGSPGHAADLRVSLLQAEHAAEAVQSRGGSGWMTHEQLSSPTLLLAAQDPEVLAGVSRALLGPVLEHDRRRGSNLLPSLQTFLDTGGKWRETAQRLHVHINTLRHRMSRVQELTGKDLDHTADRVDLYLALKALHLSGS